MDALDARRARGGVSQRKAQGAHYTPPALVDHLIAEAARGWSPSSREWRLLDPACGSGNFLVAAARTLAPRLEEPMAHFLATRVHGTDIDPVAVRLARASLVALLPPRTDATTRRRVRDALARHIVVADALAPVDSGGPGAATFDLILGNPPFLNQLEKGTAASRARAAAIARVTGGAVRRYADLSAAFLLSGLQRLAPAGRLAFVMPQSFLSTGDARAARDASLEHAGLRAIWSAHEPLFDDANVRVCALVFERGKPRPVRRAFGAGFRALRGSAPAPRKGDESWAPMLAEGFGAPRVAAATGAGVASATGAGVASATGASTIADIATATADFRDQYYGLRDAVIEGGGGPRLLTTRHIDLASCGWGACGVRILGERFTRPTVDAAGIAGRKGMDGWLDARLVPKVLVATQTKVIEAFVDAEGAYAPLVPIISVYPRARVDIWRLAAAVASPVVAARALSLYAGSALSAGAIKLSAKQLLAMPLPRDRAAWGVAASHFKAASGAESDAVRARELRAFGEASCAAHALEDRSRREVLGFWMARLK